MRDVVGAAIIHRPYSTMIGNREYKDVASERNLMIKTIKAYLRDMNVSELLFEAMDAIPPERSEQLANDKLIQYRIVGPDPVYAEKMDSACAAELGISRTDVISKRSQCLNSSTDSVDYLLCEPCKNWKPQFNMMLKTDLQSQK